MSFEPNIDGPFAASRTAPGDEPPSWPVLARLPLVGPRPATPVERLPTYAALEPHSDYPSASAAGARSAAPLRVIDAAGVEGLPSITRVDPPQHRRRATPDEPAPALARGYDWPDFDERPPAAVRPSAPRREQYRIDPAEDRVHGLHGANRRTNETLATRVARWHAALAPHAGVAVTVALILSGSLMYWLTVGRQQLAIDGDEIPNSQNSWSSETTTSPSLGAVIRPFEEFQDDFSAPLTTPEAPRVAEAAVKNLEAEAPQQAESTAESDGPPLSLGSPSPPAAEPAPPIAAESITPTPNEMPYPVTDYPWFDSGLPAPHTSQGDVDAPAPVDHPLPAAAG